jgi:hypothetical protein
MAATGGNPVRVGNGQGFWGDSIIGPKQLVSSGELDYLTMDFLAEVTMSIMQKLRRRRPDAGYATDFIDVVERVLPTCKERGIRIIANAGGANPAACADACETVVRKLGVKGVRVGIVEGDDVLGNLATLIAGGHDLANMDTGAPLDGKLDEVLSANVYLGAEPIAEALADGADIVITGRVTDPSLTLGPLIYEFGWSPRDFDLLAAGTVAGHIIECGTQCTGGNFERWEEVPDLLGIGYPVVEARSDGSFVVTKQPGTGGMVTCDTVTAQLLYELGDPTRYLTPDVIVDFTSIQLTQESEDRVLVEGIRGSRPTSSNKVSVSLHGGYHAVGQLVVGGSDAVRKARVSADLLFGRLAADGTYFEPGSRVVEIVGTNTVLFPGMLPTAEPFEVLLRVGVSDSDRAKVERFGRELASLLTSGPPGLTGFAGGRPKASEVVTFWPALIDRELVKPSVSVKEVA